MRYSARKSALLLVAFLSAHLCATTYYVAKNGSDGNPGTEGAPLQTIQAGINRASAGDVVMVQAGTYCEQVTFPRSGTGGLPITVQGATSGGNPQVTVTSADSITATWVQAPEVGSGVYKAALGFAPTRMYVDSLSIVRLTDDLMSGDSSSVHGVWPGTGLHILGFAANKKWVHPFEQTCSPGWWDAVGACYGTLGDTTYLRFGDNSNPNSKILSAVNGYPRDFYVTKDYITLKNLKIRGASYPVWVDGGSHCVVESCVVRDGYQRIGFNNGSHNAVRDCDISLGRYGATFCEWSNADADSVPDSSAYSVVQYCISKWMDGDIGCVQLINETDDEISGTDMHDGHCGVVLRPADRTTIFGNSISYTSAAAIEQQWCITHDSTTIYDNDFTHCAISYRPSQIGEPGDTCRRTYFFNNRSYQKDGLGNGMVFHEVEDYDYYIQNGDANSPEIWLYHNSFAGGSYWANPVKYACDSMRMVNNIFGSHYMVADVIATEMESTNIFRAFDYNFIGGGFRYYGKLAWAAEDTMNQWPTDSVHGDVNHQVWPLGAEPDWIVPHASSAYQAGLDLSHPFSLRGTTYGPLPGMAPGYFTGARPNLGAVQDTGLMGTRQDDSGHGSASQRPELAFAPNPTTGRYVMARWAIPTGKIGKLAVRDVLGRTVQSIALARSGITQFDLRSFAPGIYIAALDAGGPPISRKLIISAH